MKKYELVIFDLDGTILDTLDDLTDRNPHICRRWAIDVGTQGNCT